MQNFEMEKLIEKQPKKKKSVINFIFDNPYFVRSTEYGSTIKKYSEEIIFSNTGSDNYFYFVIGFFTLLFGLRSFEDLFSSYIVLCLVLILIILVWYNKTRKKEAIKISEERIEINKTTFFWNQIYDYGFTIVPKSNTSDYHLEIYTIAGEKKSFGLFNYSNPEEIMETLNFFRNRYNATQNHS